MSGEDCVKVTLAYLDTEGLRLVVGIAADDNALAVGTLEDNGLKAVFYRTEGKERAARLYEMGEMLVGVVLGGVAVGTVRRAHLNEGILLPSPGTAALVAKDEVPIVVLIAATTDVLMQQVEGVLSGTPVHLAVAALTLTADHV